jgi:hypothetical protein
MTSSSRFFERFKIQESPVLGFFNSKVQNKITAGSGSNWFFCFLRAIGQEFKNTWSLLIGSFFERETCMTLVMTSVGQLLYFRFVQRI